MESRAEKPAEVKKDLTGTKLIEIAEIRQLLPCIADSSKFRIIARISPPLGGALKLLEPLFPRARYSEKIGALIIQRGTILITIYSSGNVTMTMIKSEAEARETLEGLKNTINEAIVKGEPFLEPGLPESFNVLVKELQSLGLDVELVKTQD